MKRIYLLLLCLLASNAASVELGERVPNIIAKVLGGEQDGEWFRLNRAPPQPTLANFSESIASPAPKSCPSSLGWSANSRACVS